MAIALLDHRAPRQDFLGLRSPPPLAQKGPTMPQPPKPTSTLKLTGQYRADRHEGRGIDAHAGRPDPPDWLDAVALAEWSRVCDELEQIGVLTKADRAMITVWCTLWSQYVQADEQLRETGPTAVSPKTGGVYQHPLVGIKNSAASQLAKLAAQFGLSPSARMRVSMSKAEEPDALAELLKGRKP